MVEESFNWFCFLRPLFIFPCFYDRVFCLQFGLCFGQFPVWCLVLLVFSFFSPHQSWAVTFQRLPYKFQLLNIWKSVTESEAGHKTVEHYLLVLHRGNRGIGSCVNVAMVNKVGALCGWQTRTGMFQTGNVILPSYLKRYGCFIQENIGPCNSRSTFIQNL